MSLSRPAMGQAAALSALVLLAACKGSGGKGPSDQAIMADLNARLGATRMLEGQQGERRLFRRQFQVLVRDQDGRITCGWAGFPAPYTLGRPGPAEFTLFVVRKGRVYTPSDVSADRFEAWEKELCGPDWIRPAYGLVRP